MQVIDKRKEPRTVNFVDVERNIFFACDAGYFVKNSFGRHASGDFNAFDMETGCRYWIAPHEQVIPYPNAKIVIEDEEPTNG